MGEIQIHPACQERVEHLNIIAMKRRLALISILGFAFLGSCNAEKPAENEAGTPAEAGASKVRLKTTEGDIVIQLNAEKAPITVANFLKYVNSGHYDGTAFHRVIDGFMIQGGGFAVNDGKLVEKESGEGIKNEGQNGLKNDRGTIAMARTNDPDSASAQFFINVGNNDSLNFPSNGGYAVFGKVVEGMDVVDKIKAAETTTKQITMRHPRTGEAIPSSAGDVPIKDIVITSAKAE